jgi:anti-anti-sigma factor
MIFAPASRALRVELSRSFGTAVIVLHGELDLAGLPAFTDAIKSVEAGALAVRLDLRDLTFLDTSGARAIWGLHTTLARTSRRLEVIAGQSPARRTLEVLGLDDFLDVD